MDLIKFTFLFYDFLKGPTEFGGNFVFLIKVCFSDSFCSWHFDYNANKYKKLVARKRTLGSFVLN